MNTCSTNPKHPTSAEATDALYPYTVSYFDKNFDPYHYACYAHDVEHARLSAMEMVQHIHDHPESIKWIAREREDFDW
jgi:hypothetical protein